MPKFYVYITDRSFGAYDRVFTEMYDAESKERVKDLILRDFDYMSKVREKLHRSIPEESRFITSIHELNDYWTDIWLHDHTCKECQNKYTKFEKAKYGTRGHDEFCSIECQKEYATRFETATVDNYNSATVYMITHKPTGSRYVGVTVRWVAMRWWEHMKAKSGSPFHKFIQDHDITEFTFEILEIFMPSEHNPFAREAYWIKFYDATNIGLNTAGAHKEKNVE